MSLTTETNRTVDEILAAMTDDEIANMTEAEMEAIALGVALIVVPER